MTDYRIEAASREEWAERAFLAEAERDRINYVMKELSASADIMRERLDASLDEITRLRAELAANLGTTWDDREDDMTCEVESDHPVKRRENWPHYHKAQEAVSNRHSKGSLIGLVTHLMAKHARTEADLAAAKADRVAADNDLVDRYRNPKSGVFKFPEDVAAIVRRLDETTADLAAALEQVAGVVLAAADRIIGQTIVTSADDTMTGAQVCDLIDLIACVVRTLTPDDATAALEARDARVRAEERAKVIEEAKALASRSIKDGGIARPSTFFVYAEERDAFKFACSEYAEKLDALHTAESRAAQSSEGGAK